MEEQRGTRRARKKKIETPSDILAGLALSLEKKKTTKRTVMEFRRDPFTGDRLYKSRYRPYRSRTSRTSGEFSELKYLY